MSKEIITVLKKARRLLSKKENWTQGTGARDADGDATYALSPRATSFCAVGAIWREGRDHFGAARDVVNRVSGDLYGQRIEDLNDQGNGRQRLKVLRVFDKAIEHLKEAT